MLELYILDLIGTFAFAVYGAYAALKKKLDIFGIFIAAFLTAVGGGTIREFMLGNTPFYFFDNNYVFTILFGTFFAVILFKKFHFVDKYLLIIDAVGLATFAFIGAHKAYSSGLGTFAIIFFATITAVGGGVLRDIALKELPQIFYRDLYATPAAILGIVFSFFTELADKKYFIFGLIGICFLIRLVAILKNLHLWAPYRHKIKRTV